MNSLRFLKHLNVFIVDDDYFCSNIYKQAMKNMGFCNFHLFTTGEECLREISVNPEIVLLDYNMASVNGLQVLKVIKDKFPSTFVFMISAERDQTIAMQAIENGAFAYIPKDGNELETLSLSAIKVLAKHRDRFRMSKHLSSNRQAQVPSFC